MKILSWNCRGFAHASTVRTLRAICSLHKPDIIFLCETKTFLQPDHNPLSFMGFPFLLQVPPVGSKGGLVVAWKMGTDIEPVFLNNHQISFLVYSDPTSSPWLASCVHAPYIWGLRRGFWQDLSRVGKRFGGPWMLIGDFNAILSSAEKKGGRLFGSSSHSLFGNFVQENGLVDLGFSGNPFTWNNKRHGRYNIKERLDRGLSKHLWVLLFPNSLLSHLPASESDHNPLLLSTSSIAPNLPKPFKFEAFWTRDISSYAVIADAWNFPYNGSAAFALSRKMKASKSFLKSWNIHQFGNIHLKIKHLMSEINRIQCSPSPDDDISLEDNLQLELQEELIREESLWKQKSRDLWLTSRNLNTKFFHASTAIRRRYNSIPSLKSNDGSFVSNRVDIGSHICDYFSSLFSSTNPIFDDELVSLLPPVITPEENLSLCAIPDEREIFQVISQLGLCKAPGPDGFTGLFYKTYWSIVRLDVIKFVQCFFRHGRLLKEFNHTHLALIPKIDNPSQISQFRPISLANFTYKIISKILANRLKPLLQNIISPNQSAFLKGRTIQDNSILAHEIFHSMKKKRGSGGLMALKLDMDKAFDRMEWSFILRIFSCLGFSSNWIQLIEQCLSTVSFSVLLNGSPFGKFSASRGLRQGDPLSPFLFLLGSEVLSRLILKEELAGNIHGIKISRNSPPVAHLLFADDLMVFSKGNSSEAACILNCLEKFSAWSGQKVNLEKSSMFLSKNCSPSTSAAIRSILNLRNIPAKAKHLGLPLFFHRNKSLAFEELKLKILSNLSGWKSKLLSQAARSTLIKTVANAMPSYSMSMFLFPKPLCKVIDLAIRKFWWGFPQEKSHNLFLLGWNRICSPIDVGGLGFRIMECQNSALLSKIGWKILTNQDLLWVRALSTKYLHSHNFLSSPTPQSASWLWKGVLKCRSVVAKGACWLVSSGTNLNIWSTPWIPSLAGFKPSPNSDLTFLPNLNVSDLISPVTRDWYSPILNFLFDPISVEKIKAIHLPQSPSLDRWVWTPSPNGSFSVKSAHSLISNPTFPPISPLSPSDWKSLWSLRIQHRLKHLLWRISWNILPIRTNIFRFLPDADLEMVCCPMCSGPPESLQHLFLGCPFARSL
jgi:hypothetical protein